MAAHTKFYGLFDAEGRATAYYNSDIYPPQENGERNAAIPAEVVEITQAQWQELISNPLARYVDNAIIYVEPPPLPPPEPNPTTVTLYDHENRLRSMEGQPPLSLQDFIVNVNGGA